MSASRTTASKTNGAAPAVKDELTTKVEKLELRTKAVNTNDIARVANAKVTTPEAKLTPLMALKTNRPIDKFPATVKDIQKLTDNHLDAILLALEADRSGKKEQKIEKLRLHIGLKASAV